MFQNRISYLLQLFSDIKFMSSFLTYALCHFALEVYGSNFYFLRGRLPLSILDSCEQKMNETVCEDIETNNKSSDCPHREHLESKIGQKGHWTPAEDAKLRELVQRYGPQNWNFIADHLQERSGKSCRLRWYNQLDPRINRRPFTEEEEERLVMAHRLHGNKWAMISRLFPGRTDNAVKNHWHVITARNFRKRSRTHSKQKPWNFVRKKTANSSLSAEKHIEQRSLNIFMEKLYEIKTHWNPEPPNPNINPRGVEGDRDKNSMVGRCNTDSMVQFKKLLSTQPTITTSSTLSALPWHKISVIPKPPDLTEVKNPDDIWTQQVAGSSDAHFKLSQFNNDNLIPFPQTYNDKDPPQTMHAQTKLTCPNRGYHPTFSVLGTNFTQCSNSTIRNLQRMPFDRISEALSSKPLDESKEMKQQIPYADLTLEKHHIIDAANVPFFDFLGVDAS